MPDLKAIINFVAKDNVTNAANSASKSINNFENKINKLKANLTKTGAIMSAAITTPLVMIGKASLDSAADFENAMTAYSFLTEQAGTNSEDLMERMRAAANSTVSDYDLMMKANKAMSLNFLDDTDQIVELLELARVKGRAFGRDTTEAFDDLVTGIGRGSPLILDNLGIITKGWDEEAKAAGVAFDSNFILNKVLEDGRIQLEQMGPVQETTAEKMQQMKAAMSNFKTEIGEALIPILTPFIEKLRNIVQWFDNLDASTKETIVKVALFVAAIGPLLLILGQLIGAVQAVGGALLFLAANPVGMVIAALVAIGVAIGVLWTQWDDFRYFVLGIWESIKSAAQAIANWFNEAFIPTWNIIWNAIKTVVSTIVNGIKGAIQEISNTIQTIIDFFNQNIIPAWQAVWDVIGGIVTTITGAIGTAIQGVVSAIQTAIGWIKDLADAASRYIEGVKKRFHTMPSYVGGRKSGGGSSKGTFTGIPHGSRQHGGPVSSGNAYIVGEAGPELFVPGNNGNIIPNNAMGGITINVQGSLVASREEAERMGDIIIQKLQFCTQTIK